ncbi:MAG: hypothetical protein ACRCZ9_01790 [Fusobacteriaceae bacterium]
MKLVFGFEPALQESLTSGGVEKILESKLAMLSLTRDKQKDDGDLKYYNRVIEIELSGNVEEVLYDGLLETSELETYSELTYVCLSGENDELTTFSYDTEFGSIVNGIRNYLEMDLLLRGDK